MDELFIAGRPIPQGSTKAYVVKGRAHITADNPATKPWRAIVSTNVLDHIRRRRPGAGIVYPVGGVAVVALFVMPRRATEPIRTLPAHTRKPDLDKLVRSVFDACTGILWADDAQVTDLVTSKRTAAIGEVPGLHLRWSAIPA